MDINLEEVATVDFETYFDKEYSLKSKELNMSDYVRDERFLAHCVSIKLGRAPTQIYWYADIRPAIEAIEWGRYHVLAHNTAFDGFILSEHYDVVPPNPQHTPLQVDLGLDPPRYYLDTMSMARALHAGSSRASLEAIATLYGFGGKNPNILMRMKGHREIPREIREEASVYCIGDTDKCFGVFSRMVEVYPEAELALIDWTIRQFCDPVLRVDIPRASAELEREVEHKARKIEKVGLDEDELQSAAKFAAQLRKLDVEPPKKISARTKLPTFAFAQSDDEFMQLCAHPDERVRDLMAARLAAKSTIGETRAARFVAIGDRPLPVGLGYAVAHTLRWGGTNKMNLQNLEKEELDESGAAVLHTGELRKSIIAPPGHMVCVADSGQIEARITAYVAGQEDLLRLFATGGDPYCALASEIYGSEVTKSDRDRRAVGKAAVLGLGYYMGAARFQGTLALGTLGPKQIVDIEFAQQVVDTYRTKNKKIKALWRLMDNLLLKMLHKANGVTPPEAEEFKFPGLIVQFDGASIWLPSGMGLHYPDLKAEWDKERRRFFDYSYRSNKEFVRIHSGVITENLIQRLARDVVAEQLLKINERWRVVLFTHDELVALAPEHEAEECMKHMFEVMTTPPSWLPGLPLKAEGDFSREYSK